jgi:hypothetical protein
MKIMVINEVTASMGSLPQAEKIKVREAMADWLDKHQKEGKCLQVYSDCLGQYLVSIWELTPEECFAVGLTAPIRDYVTIQYFPLIEPAEVKKALESAKA